MRIWPSKVQYPTGYQAHRGWCGDGDLENTLSACEAAARQGFEICEVDIQLSRDMIPIVFHDSDLSRLHGEDSLVAELTAIELANFGIPTLEELLHSRAPRWLNLELKWRPGGEKALVRAVSDRLVRYRGAHKYFVSSFHPKVLYHCHKVMPRVLRALITDRETAQNRLYCHVARPNAIHFGDLSVTDEFLALCKFPVAVWTVNDAQRAGQLSGLGISNLITDQLNV